MKKSMPTTTEKILFIGADATFRNASFPLPGEYLVSWKEFHQTFCENAFPLIVICEDIPLNAIHEIASLKKKSFILILTDAPQKILSVCLHHTGIYPILPCNAEQLYFIIQMVINARVRFISNTNHQHHLEQLLKERTIRLKQANAKLLQEIKRHRSTEKELQTSRQQFQDLALASADCLWEADMVGRYLKLYGRIKETFGYEPEELIGNSPFEYMKMENGEYFQKVFYDHAVQKKALIDIITKRKTKDEKTVYILTNGIPTVDEDGNATGFRGTSKNITEQIEAQIKIWEKNQELEKTMSDLRQVLAQAEEEKGHIYQTININIKKRILPLLKNTSCPQALKQKYRCPITELEVQLNNIGSGLFKKLEDLRAYLTDTEMQLCQYLRSSYSTKEIAQMQNISIETVKTHCKNIRKKLGITNKKISLATFLSNL